jgi:streptogramin lyase
MPSMFDETDAVWVSDWGANPILRFDPRTEKFQSFPLPDQYASVRQLAGRKGEVWGAESAADKIFVLKPEQSRRYYATDAITMKPTPGLRADEMPAIRHCHP